MNDDEVSYEVGDGTLAAQYHEDICDLYSKVFSRQPFVWHSNDSEAHGTSLQEMRKRGDFVVVLAMYHSTIIGFAYGHRLPVDHGWWRDFIQPLPSKTTDEWDGRTFALIDFAVAQSWRGRGVGPDHIVKVAEQSDRGASLAVGPAKRSGYATHISEVGLGRIWLEGTH